MANLITGLFSDESAAENAVRQLKQVGYSQNEISLVMQDRAAGENLAHETGSRTMSNVGEGAAIGGTIGAVLFGLLGLAGSVVIPGVGLIAAGAAAAAWAGAGIGGVAGGLIGWLVNIGVPNDLAPYYERGLQNGGVVVSVAAHNGDEARVAQILHSSSLAYGGYNTPSYINPDYRARYNDIKSPTAMPYS